MGRLRSSVTAAVGLALDGVECRDRGSDLTIPTTLRTQARLAARMRVSIDVVLRRYCVGQAAVAECVLQEATGGDPADAEALRWISSAHAEIFERLISVVTDEYNAELRRAGRSGAAGEERRVDRVERLLRGEDTESAMFRYDFAACHVALIVSGEEGSAQLQELGDALDRLVFTVSPSKDLSWAWLGGQGAVDPSRIESLIASTWPDRLSVAIGEPAEGLEGWRLSHRQARAVLPIALRSGRTIVRYADEALLASILQDELLASALRRTYLESLESERGDGPALRETLRAYFAAERNVTSAAAALGVTRHTVSSRLRVAEERLGRMLGKCATELDAALRLEHFDAWPSSSSRSPTPSPRRRSAPVCGRSTPPRRARSTAPPARARRPAPRRSRAPARPPRRRASRPPAGARSSCRCAARRRAAAGRRATRSP